MTPTLTDRDALLAAVLAEPGEDLHRLAYADWLEESGDLERAEFIRVQLATAGEPQKTGMPYRRWKALHERGRELLLRHWPEWVPRLSAENSFEVILSNRWEFSGTPAVLFRRGFVDEVRLTIGDFTRGGAAVGLFRTQPVQRVELTDREPNGAGYGTGRRWWSRANFDDSIDPPWWLPTYLFDLLPYVPAKTGFPGTNRAYDSDAEARGALSRACILWARSPGARRA